MILGGTLFKPVQSVKAVLCAMGQCVSEEQGRRTFEAGLKPWAGLCGWPVTFRFSFYLESGYLWSASFITDTGQMFSGVCAFVPLIPHNSVTRPSPLHT